MALLDLHTIRSKLNLDELYNNFLWLDKRQQGLIVVVLLVVLIVVMILPVNCVSSKLNEKEKEFKDVVKTAATLNDRLAEYNRLKQGVGQEGKSSTSLGTDPLKKIIYQITDELGIDRHLAKLKTIQDVDKGLFLEEGKEVNINNIDFTQAVQLIEQLLAYPDVPVRINKLTAKPDRRNKQRMQSLVMTVTILKPKQEEPKE